MANMIVRADGTKVEVSKATHGEIKAYLDDCTAQFMEINSKAVAAGRKAPFENPRMTAMKYELVPQKSGGFLIRERKTPLIDEDTAPNAIVKTVTSLAAGLDRSINRGKYNDSMRLLGEDTASIEIGELQSASGANNGMN